MAKSSFSARQTEHLIIGLWSLAFLAKIYEECLWNAMIFSEFGSILRALQFVTSSQTWP
jgi:hypothetical protein